MDQFDKLLRQRAAEEPVPVPSMLSVQPARQKGIGNLVRYWAGSLSLVPLPWQLVIPWSWAGS